MFSSGKTFFVAVKSWRIKILSSCSHRAKNSRRRAVVVNHDVMVNADAGVRAFRTGQIGGCGCSRDSCCCGFSSCRGVDCAQVLNCGTQCEGTSSGGVTILPETVPLAAAFPAMSSLRFPSLHADLMVASCPPNLVPPTRRQRPGSALASDGGACRPRFACPLCRGKDWAISPGGKEMR